VTSIQAWQDSLQKSILTYSNCMAAGMLAPDHPDPVTGLKIYQNAYLLRLAEALQSNYPCLYHLLGEEDFGHLFLEYRAANPPENRSIRWFGASFADFLLHQNPAKTHQALADIARFEWALRHTIDAADADPIRYPQLAAMTQEEWISVKFRLHPSVSLPSLEWNAPAIWQSWENGQKPPDFQHGLTHWLIYRGGDGSGHWRSVPLPEYLALKSISGGATFPDICEQIALNHADNEQPEVIAATYLGNWTTEGILIAGQEMPEEPPVTNV
jgi:hypothetical protein